MRYVLQAVLSNAQHPEYGQATIPFPIPNQNYDSTIAPSAERMPPQADCALPALMSWHTGCCIRDCTAEPARVQP